MALSLEPPHGRRRRSELLGDQLPSAHGPEAHGSRHGGETWEDNGACYMGTGRVDVHGACYMGIPYTQISLNH